MEPRERRPVRYEDIVRRQRRPARIAMGVSAGALALAAAAGAAWWTLAPVEQHTPPRALIASDGPTANEVYQWKHVAVGGGGFITGLSMDPAGRSFVVRADVYGAYIWDARANRWKQLATAPAMPAADRTQDGIATGAYEVAVAPSRPDRIYMAIKGNVYRSDDRGRSFVLASAGNPFPLTWNANSEYRLSGPFMAVDPRNPDLILLGTPADGLWRSADAGAHWRLVASVPASKDRQPADGVQAPGAVIWFETPAGGKPTGRIFVSASGYGMYLSHDGGASFAPLPAIGAGPTSLRRGAFDRHGVFFGVDEQSQAIWSYRGGAWHNLSNEGGLPALPYGAVAANPRADQVVVFDQSGKGYQTTDGGANWHAISHEASVGAGDPPWLTVANAAYFATGDIAFDPAVPNRLWVAAGTGVFYADLPPDSVSVNWISQTRGIEELVANDIVQPPGQSPIFAGWDFGLHVKDDLNAYSTTFGPNARALMTVQQIDWTPADPHYLVTNASDARIGCCAEDGNAVMAGYSRDGGHKWIKFPTLPTPPGTKPDDPWKMAFGTIAVSSSDADNIVWEPAYDRAPYYTTDRGANWTSVVLPGSSGDAYGSFQATYYQRKTLTADKSLPATFYLYHSGEAPNQALAGLWRSKDGGAHWALVHAGEIAPASNFAAKLRSVPGHAGHLFFTADFPHTTDTALKRSTDGGVTWAAVPGVTRVDDVAFGKAAKGAGYPTIFISGRVRGSYGIWRSTDAAASWQRLTDFPVGTLDQVTAIGADPDVFGRVYLGYVGSSWIWGEPAACKPAPLPALAVVQCSAVER